MLGSPSQNTRPALDAGNISSTAADEDPWRTDYSDHQDETKMAKDQLSIDIHRHSCIFIAMKQCETSSKTC